ncbi:MAG TPA: hypothetical protein VLH40_00020 [Atribacteraceae bacterium]|nr:hypothetical protein [Atribacteraceae bacterium]
MYSRRITKAGAIAGMLGGFISTMVWYALVFGIIKIHKTAAKSAVLGN